MLPPRGGLMACPATPQQCRAAHIAVKLRDAEQDGTDWEARCPVCGHESFRVSEANAKSLRNVWTCACKPCRCKTALRAALLGLRILPGCLGIYGLGMKTHDPAAAAALAEAADLILAWPGLDPSEMRLILADARGDKFPAGYRDFARFAQDIGIGRRHSYNLAEKHCRPSDSPPPPGEGSADA